MEYWPGIHSLEASRVSNVYLVMSPPITLIDTGPPGALTRIIVSLERINVRPADIKRIILTHCDVDHVGNAHALRAISDAQVYAHSADLLTITGAKPAPGPALRRLMGSTWGRACLHTHVDQALEDGDDLDGLIVHHLPGHTPGHIGIQSGRALVTGDVIFGGRTLRPSPPPITWDKETLRLSLIRIGEMDVDILLPGHGTPVNDGAQRCRQMASML